MKKVHLTFLLPVLLLWNFLLYGQSYQALVLGGFNEDVIANGIGSAASSTTNYLDRDAFCIQSLDWKLTASSSALTFGLPVDGIINSVVSATPGLFFKLQDYSANNVIQLRSNGNSITSSVTGQVKAEKLYLLATSASGSSSLQCMVNFDDNSFQIQSIILPDWYDGTNPPVAYLGFGRVTRLSSVLEYSISNPRLHQITLPINLENQDKEIKSISFTHVQGNGIINIFGATAELVTPCKSPEIVSFSSITSSSAQVSFVPPNPLPAAGYDFEVRSSGLPDSGTTGLLGRGAIANSSTTITCSSLPMGERVNFYIRSKCSAISLGEWKGPFTFTTLCAARGVFNENFESQPVGSTIDASLPSCWGKISNGNGYLYTSNASAYSGMHSLYLYNSNQTTGDLMVVSPPTNQLGNGGYRIRFRARSTFFQEVTLKVVTLENPYDTANMQMLDEIELTNSYKEYFVNVPAGTANYFGLAHGLTTGYQAIYIDDIHLEPIPPCIVPTDLTVSAVGLSTATIAWTATSSLNTDGYVYEVRTSGEAGSGTSGLVFSGRSDSNVTRVNLNNLIAGTTYHAYVKANCTATDESYWTDAVTFTPNWCMPTYQNGSSNHRITKVNIDELAFTDEITSYTQRDRTNLSIPDLQAGSSYTFNVTTTGYTIMGVAIDFNNDGVFDQNTEVLALPDYIVNNTQVYTAQVIIPNGIASGNYRMRIWNRGANAGGGMGTDPCGAYNYGTWADYTVRVQEATLPPVAVNQVFCKSENKKVGDLIATGENIKWYTSETATTALLPSTLLSSGTYYATQTIGGYESVRRTAIQVEVDDPKLNSISVSSSFQYGTQTQVVLIGIRTVLGPHVLTWYETEAGGTSIPTPDINLLPVGTHVYWVSTFSTYGCESKRSKINLVVNPMSLYITPTVVNKFYGDADPELTYTIYGGYNDVPLTGSLVRDVGENAGNYAIRQGTLTASANYSLTITTAYLTILPAPLTVTADAKTKEIGAADPILTYQVSGLKNGETAHDILLGGLTRTPGELEGIYPITQGSLALQSPNYTLTYNSANLTIESKVVTVKANTQRKSYGDADPELTYTVSGLGSTVDPATILTGSLSREPGESVGTYLITQGTLAVVSGYTLEFEGANLTIDPAVLTVTADAQTKIYGDTDPVLTYTISGLKNNDQPNILTGILTRDNGEDVGFYSIHQGTIQASTNYTLAFQAANLTIIPALLTIQAEAKTKVYGDADPLLTYTVSGLKNNDQPTILTGILTRDSGEDVGFYSIHQGNIQASTNYTLAFQAASLTITPALLTVSAEAKTKVYGDADPLLTYTVSGLKNNDQPTILTGILTREVGESVGTYEIQQGSLSAPTDYALVYQAADLTITPAVLTVKANAQTKIYGDTDPVLTYTVSGLKNNDQPTILTGSLVREVGESVGTYEIQQGSLSAPADYTLVYQGDDLAITPAVLTVKANAQTKIYGDTDPALTYTVLGLKNNDQPTILTGILTREVGESVGTYEIQQGSLTAPTDYTLVYQGADLAITPALLTVKADAQTKIYGDTDPALTYTVSGLKNNDQPTILTGILTREVGESVGTYEIQQGSLGAPSDYTLVYQGADLAITPAVLTVTADAQTKVYGDTDPALTYTVSGLKNNDQPTILTGSLVREVGESVGTYEIQQGSLSAPTDYTIVYQAADLTITPAVLTVTADAQTKVYGDTDPVLTYTVSGLQGTDRVTGSLVREVGESVGTYEIQQGSLSAPTDYTLVYQGADLAITPAVLTVTADAQTKVYGDTDPALTYTVSGLQGTDRLTGSLVREVGESVGTYEIQQGSLSAPTDYTLVYQGADLAITPAVLTVTADAQTKVYGDTDPVLTYTVSGLKNNDQPTILTGSLVREVGESVGTYEIQQGSLSAPADYTLVYQAADLAITPAVLTVTADAQTKIYGDADPVLTYTVSGLKNNDQPTILTGTLTREVGESVGTYEIQQGSLSAPADYTLVYQAADLAITPAVLTVTADAQTKIYGDTDPVLTYTVSGLKNNDQPTILTGSLVREVGESVGTYEIQQGSLSAPADYTLVYQAADLAIAPAVLTVTADAQTKIYGDTDPVLTYTVSGLKNNDQPTILTGTLTRDRGEDVGSYSITQGTIQASTNYTLVYQGADLAITPAVLTVKANAQTKVYGDTDPVLTYTVSGLKNNDQPTILTGTLTRDSGEDVGTYSITQGTIQASTNYTLAFQSANLTITPALLTIRAEAKTKVYGDADPVLTYTVSGLKVQDQVAASVRGNLSRQRGENVGTYAIQQGDLQVIANYTFTFEEALLAITPAPLIIQPVAGQQKLYGATDPLFAFTVTGFKFNDGIRTALTGSLGRAAGENVNQYAYQIGSLQAVFANYSLTLDNQEQFEIKPAPLRLVVEENQFKRFGEADPVLRYRADGLQRGDFIIQAVVGQLTRSAGEAVGLYAIAQGSLSARANYYIDSFIPASFEIKKNNIEGLTFPAQRFVYDGQVKQLQVQGNIQPQATIVYTNNNQTQVGQYTVTATVDYGPNYEILRLQSILTIVKADQEITWNQVSEVVLEDTPTLQLIARASSNLPVSYTIDEAADREIAVVEETGLLRFLQPGFVTITASQGGNTNFNAAKTVSHTIAVSSRDASIWDLIVDGVSYGKIAKEVHLVLGCETQQDEVTFAVHTQVGAEVQPSNHFTLSVKDYGIYEQVITVQSPNKKVTETYKIVIDKRIPTEHLVIQKYNNVLLVNNNKQTNGGYVFQAYRWFKNGELVGEKQAYSAGDEYGTTLDPQATYEVELTLYNGKKIRSCPIVIKGKATANWSVYPNPVQKSQWLYVQMKEEKPGMVHYIIYNLKGQLIKRGSLEGSVKGIEIPTTVASGSYFLILKTEDTQEGVQFIIQ